MPLRQLLDDQELSRMMSVWHALDGTVSVDRPSQRRQSCRMSPLQWTDLGRQTWPSLGGRRKKQSGDAV